MKSKVYLESSVISYFTAKPSRDLIQAAHQEITRNWWEIGYPLCECFISAYVVDEIQKGDPVAAQKRLDAVRAVSILTSNPEVDNLAEQFFEKMKIPDHAKLDCFHLASAVINGMEYILSWNFKHIANPTIKKIYREINQSKGLVTPEICTPEEMLGEV
jgi:hypothetical protein